MVQLTALGMRLRVQKVIFAFAWTAGAVVAHAGAPHATEADYRASLQQAQALVAGCAASAADCNPGGTSPDLVVQPGGYTVRYGWLRAALLSAKTAKPAERTAAMTDAATRLGEALAELDGPPPPPDSNARAAVSAILREKQFQQVTAGPTWWQRQTARFWQWLDRLLLRAAMASAQRPWLGLAIEWTLLVGCVAALLAYAFGLFRRERQQSAKPWRDGADQHPSTDAAWLERAEAAAAREDWREAVHALYWASIRSMAQAGRWQAAAGSALTPREYLRLLPPGSAQQGALASLTRLLEKVWYARRPAAAPEFAQARELATALGVPQRGSRSE